MTKILKTLHNWIGFFISLIMLVVLTTGVYLGGVDLLKRWDSKGQVYTNLSHEQKAQIVAMALAKYPEASGVKLPTEMFPYVEASSREKSTYLTTGLEEIGSVAKSDNEVWRFIFFFHRNFQLSDPGKHVNAISAILATVIMFIGLYLWWLIRQGFRWKKTLPKNGKNSALIKSHIQLGLIFSIPLLIMSISGAYITYGSWGDSTLDDHRQQPILAQAGDWEAQIIAAQKIWPESELVSVSKPRKAEEGSYLYSLSFNGDNTLGLLQTDTIKIDLLTGKLDSAQTFSDKGLTYQLKYSARFLHDGTRMPTWYLLILIISSIVGTFMVAFVIVTFTRKELLGWFKTRSILRTQ
ncbi:PepSY domain-containing protein [Shewanella sp. D64]|uniref:PepSY-associated TM helix domain-containing protein n=1 Tax=unclassified Shewanella TaxID=196818 RepID=UPI0022BA480B|nr:MULTISPECIES: PepSY-associated TM helix domain-containing protein [unclassified Shewanella]MEC4724060.1 PepSY domain-containing protein [Shewanella sp. D64]MEC4736080.1 PepSY domain-containing protein [Shewanella sp. E94]WBJ97976.1 PepSY domain-containing protein [Shewanella sp. MTB7]